MLSASADFEFALALSSWPTRACAGYRSGGIRRAGVGIGTTDTQFSQEPAVAYDIDDVYYPSCSARTSSGSISIGFRLISAEAAPTLHWAVSFSPVGTRPAAKQ